MNSNVSRLRLMVIIGSTRPGRVGLPVGQWLRGRVEAHGRFELDLVDLAELNLPFIDEPAHPRLRQYTKQHTKDWSARVEAADAFVFITPEYNHGMNAPLKNAIDFLSQEWGYKPVGFVSYGGVAGGVRAVLQLKHVATVLRMMPIADGVVISLVTRFMSEDGTFTSDELLDAAATTMLCELERWAVALTPMRGNG